MSYIPKHRILTNKPSKVAIVVAGFDVEEVGFFVAFLTDESVFILVGRGFLEDDTLWAEWEIVGYLEDFAIGIRVDIRPDEVVGEMDDGFLLHKKEVRRWVQKRIGREEKLANYIHKFV